MKKRLCNLMSCLLAIVLVVGLIPMIVSAAEAGTNQVFEGASYAPGTGATIELKAEKVNDQPVTHMTFDYTIESGETFNIALMPDWSNFYGYLKFNANGEFEDYAGVETKNLDNGAIRVYVDLGKVTKVSGTPSNVIKLLYVHSGWTTATGTISNIRINDAAEHAPRGEIIEPGVNKVIDPVNVGELEFVTFDYKVDNGAFFNVALMPDWSNFFGYYAFTATGAYTTYAGVSTEVLADGYVRATFDMAALTKVSGTPTTAVDFLFVRGDWSDVNGYIDNLQFITHVHNYNAVVTAPTCTAGGYTTYTCACGDTYTGDATEALGHNYESVVTAPSMSAQGYTTHTCANCGDSYVDSYTDFVLESYLVLTENVEVNLTMNQDLYVDLNGFTMSGVLNTNGFKVYGMDAATNGYTCDAMGYFSCVDAEGNAIVPQSNVKTDLSGDVMRYVTVATENGYTFHRIYVGITKRSLAPSVTGVGYKAEFYGDEMVQAQVTGIGYNLWLEGGKTVSRDAAFQNELTLRVKNFDAVNYGETNLYASVWMTIGGETITSTECSLTLRQMVESVNAAVSAYSEEQLQAVRDMIAANPVMESWQIENILKEEVIRGQAIASGTDLICDLGNTELLETLSFDYKVTDGTFNIALMMEDWSNYYGYFAFDAYGNVDAYDGVTLETLEDGYIRVTFDLNALTKYTGSPSAAISLLYIRGNWTDATGYIDNIQYKVYKPTLNFEGAAYAAGTGVTIELKGDKLNDLAVERMTFDYTVESGEYFHIALMPDWSSYYGYIKFDANGAAGNYAGIVTEKLDGGVIRVYVDLSKVTTVYGTPSNVLTLLYVRGDWTNANGTISNICINDAAAQTPRGEGVDTYAGKTILLNNKQALETISFEYKMVSGTKFNIALMPDWSSSFGYFAFGADGARENYAGVTSEVLEDGYVRVTFDMNALTKMTGTPSTAIDFLYIRSYDWSDAFCYIDNVTYTVYQPTLNFAGAAYVPGTGAVIELKDGKVNDQAVTRLTFDYTVESGEYFHIALMPDWSSYYGYYKFDANGVVGNYPGVVTKKLEDGAVRAYIDLSKASTVGTPSNVITMLYVRGDWTNANGTISNICINDAAEYAPRGELVDTSAGKTIVLNNTQEIKTISFEYKMVDGTKFNIALMPDWSNSFGYYAFGPDGARENYAGVTTEVLEDGYIRVTFDLNALTKMTGTPSTAISFMYIRNYDWSDANCYIDNVQFTVQ